MKLPYGTSISGDYEYHVIRPRYEIFIDYEAKLGQRRMIEENPVFEIKRKIIFPRWCRFMNLINHNRKMIYNYERTGLRYLIPAIEIELWMKKK